jgi:NADH-quinone oxidoreductase subunit M
VYTAALPWLTLLIAIPIAAGVLLRVVRPLHAHARAVGIIVSLVVLAGAIAATATDFQLSAAGSYQLTEQVAWIPQIGASYALGVNGLGLTMVFLTAFVVPVVLLAGVPATPDRPTTPDRAASYVALVLLFEGILVAVFSARDVFLFYVLFEVMLLPIFLLIGHFGGARRRFAATKFLVYSLVGGFIMLIGVIALFVYGPGGEEAFLIENLAGAMSAVPDTAAKLIFLTFLVAFAIKAPMVPVHTWLPDTAEHSPAGVSTLLVGVMDKVGTFGIIALLLVIFPEQVAWAAPVVIVLAVISILYGAILAIGSKDIMRLIAFTSISHFGFIVLGIFIGSEVALTGAMFYMIAHGLSTAGLFLISEQLTKRGGTQRIGAYGGFQRVTPILAGAWLVAGLATISLPGLSGFWGEYMVLLGTFQVNWLAAVFSVVAVVLAALYVLMPYQRMFTGPKPEAGDGLALDARTGLAHTDLDGSERVVAGAIVAGMLALGLYPAPVVDVLQPVSERVVVISDAPDFSSSGDAPIDEAGTFDIDGSAP